MLFNLDKGTLVGERKIGSAQVSLVRPELGHTLGVLLILPRPRGGHVRLVITEPLGIRDYLARARGGEDVREYTVFSRSGEKHSPIPLHGGPEHIYLNFPPGSGVGGLMLCLCGLKHRLDWSKVNPNEIMGTWHPEELSSWEDLLLPEEVQSRG